MSGSMDRFDRLAEADRSKVRFIHLNHTNRARYPDSPQALEVARRGYRLAQEGESVCLG
ncbi:MAG TPA: hypothetical protein VLJ13_02015 [Brevundimonas sp.]|nr:hypothetical protein [Brevundimonas sp.]